MDNVMINGSERPLKCNQMALEVFTELVDFDNGTATSAIYATVYGMLKGGAYVNRQKMDISFEQVCDWCDSQMQTNGAELQTITDQWANSFAYRTWLSKMKGDDVVEDQKKNL